MTNYYGCDCGIITHNVKKKLKCISCKSECVNLFVAPKYFYYYKCVNCGNNWKSTNLCSHKSKCLVCNTINGLPDGFKFEQLYEEVKNVIILLRKQKSKLYSQVDPTFQRLSLILKNKIKMLK